MILTHVEVARSVAKCICLEVAPTPLRQLLKTSVILTFALIVLFVASRSGGHGSSGVRG